MRRCACQGCSPRRGIVTNQELLPYSYLPFIVAFYHGSAGASLKPKGAEEPLTELLPDRLRLTRFRRGVNQQSIFVLVFFECPVESSLLPVAPPCVFRGM